MCRRSGVVDACVLAVILCGCSARTADSDGAADGGSGIGGEPVTLDEYAAREPAARCAYFARCAPALAARNCSPGIGFADEFADAATAAIELGRELIARGTVAFHADHAGLCLAAYATEACQAPLATPAACTQVFEGLVALDGACWRDEECAGPTERYCAGSACVGTGQAPGKCSARPASSESCVETACAPGLVCVRGYCPFPSCPSNGTCAAPVVANEGGSCTGSMDRCADGLGCNGWTGLCEKPRPAGEPCTERGPHCDATVGVCVVPDLPDPPAVPEQPKCLAYGAGGEGNLCAPGTCGPGLACVQAGPVSRCVKGGVAAGLSCAPGNYRSACADGSYCDGGTRVCTARKGESAVCGSTYGETQCALGMRCLNGQCTAGGRTGDSCSVPAACVSRKCGADRKCAAVWACAGS